MKRPKGFVTRQAKRLSDGEINRRRFVMSALSAGVTMPTALSLASKAEASVPKPGGVLRMGLAEGTAHDVLDPAKADNAFTRTLALAQGNGLTEIDAHGDVVGELAKTLEPTPDHRRWTLTLRPDVTFQNGAPLTADDVVGTLRHRHVAGLLPNIADIAPLSTDQVAITLEEADRDLPRRLADPRLMILSRESTPETPIGTGPYRLDRFEPGMSAELARNPHFWKPAHAHFDRIHLRAIPDPIARQTALMTGEIDYADRIDPRSVALLRQVLTLTVTEAAAGRHLSLTFNRKAPPFDRPDLRAALCHATPGPAMAERLLFGHGTGAEPEGGFDLERAAALFRRSGHRGAIPVSVSDDPVAQDAARLIAETAAGAGMTLELTAAAGCRIEVAATRPRENADIHVALWINDIAAHVKTLHRGTGSAANPPAEGVKLLERGWFA